MTNVALIGAGKMGVSHLSILSAHPDVKIVGISDTSKMILDVFKKYSSYPCFTDYEQMLETANPDAVVVAVPTKFHFAMVKKILDEGRHVFSEKPLCLTAEEGRILVDMAERKGLVNQVGYHNKFVGTFKEAKRIIDGQYIGDLFHFVGEAYGPVVIKPKQDNWRADPKEGGGCLMDYASHVIDLINHIIGPINNVKGALLKSLYSKNVEDAVFALLEVNSTLSGVLSVNWSDETYRKMSTGLTVIGTKGKIICDANELKVFFKNSNCPTGYTKGWNVKYVTDLTDSVDFYLRGEEYSLQIDHFIKSVEGKIASSVNSFESAWHTDRVISLIKNNVTIAV
jgi:predicted dehydrogenase